VRGIDKVRLIALWDGKNDLAEDLDVYLVKHMVDLMRDTGGMVEQINPTKLSAELLNDPLEAVHTENAETVLKKQKTRRKPRPKSTKGKKN